jgi:hypothetical protein
MERDYLLRVCGLPPERVVVAGPAARSRTIPTQERAQDQRSQILFFSEPYESAGWRTEEIYKEILPQLARLAHEFGRKLVVKLHPFESRHQRMALIAKVLSPAEAPMVDVVEGPFTPELVAKAWFALTVESTTVIDCSLLGVPCFVCEWLISSPYGYTSQYARFGVGRILQSREQLNEIPRVVMDPAIALPPDCLLKPMDPEWLRQIIAGAANPKETVRTILR